MATLAVGSILATLGLLAIGLAYQAHLQAERDQTQAALTQSQEQMLRLYVANGTRLMDEGNLFDALVWFAEAFERNEKGGVASTCTARAWQRCWGAVPDWSRSSSTRRPCGTPSSAPTAKAW